MAASAVSAPPLVLLATHTTGMALTKIKALFKALEDPLNGPDRFHEIRSQIFQQIDLTSRPLFKERVSNLFNDKSLTHAESVGTDLIFAGHPAAHVRLNPLAQAYIAAFQAFKSESTDTPTFPEAAFRELIVKHISFTQAYVKECVQAYPTDTMIVNYTHSGDIAFFKSEILRFLASCNPDEQKEFLQKIRDADPEVFLLLPKICLLGTIQSTKPLPKFFESQQTQIQDLKERYTLLSAAEKESLFATLKGVSAPTRLRSFIQEVETLSMESTRGGIRAGLATALLENIMKDFSK